MTGKRYFNRMYEENYYIFDSQVISESNLDKKVEYEEYNIFEDSMNGDEVVNRLNKLNDENKEFKQLKKIIEKKIVELAKIWYDDRTDSKKREEVNLQMLILEDVRDEIKNTRDELKK